MYKVMGTGSRSMLTHPNHPGIMSDLAARIRALREEHPDLLLISGMAEGWDEAIATVGQEEDISYVVYLPNEGYGRYYWGNNSLLKKNRMARFNELLASAQEVIYVCSSIYVKGVHSNFLRNQAMVDVAELALVYEGGTPGTRQTVQLLKKSSVPYEVYPFEEQK